MKRWFAIWIAFALFLMVWSTYLDPLYHNLPCPPPSPPSQVCDLNWMGIIYVTLRHLIAIGTADFVASWFFLLVPPLVLWYAGRVIVVVARRVAIMLGLRRPEGDLQRVLDKATKEEPGR
jgi:hypothetical protein